MCTLPEDTAVIIVDHGSKRAAANEMLEAVCALYQEATGARIVEAAHMELAAPDIAEAMARCVARGARRVVISLFFLSPGRHSTSDIPRLAREAAAAHPGIALHIAEPMGLDRRLAEVLHARVTEALQAPA